MYAVLQKQTLHETIFPAMQACNMSDVDPLKIAPSIAAYVKQSGEAQLMAWFAPICGLLCDRAIICQPNRLYCLVAAWVN